MKNELSSLLGTMEKIYERKDKLETELAGIAEDEKNVRNAISGLMEKSGTRSQYSPEKKIMAYISQSSNITIVDEVVVKAYLKSNGLLESCLKLDPVAVKRYAKATQMPGTALQTRESLNIKLVKEKVEQVTAEETATQYRDRVRQMKSEESFV